ncbi:hypothetical protein MYMAC_007198 [Corallococcus macrosporus DSM 14697]|uniref:Uncharacterized protein n=1 Tax=Corallococcus macrosporus DSM 14697 TaxID=1189310 RepID=A0A286SGL0_9BACT|nr:hypothetical protein MYMAC_007198 [Corallococcus macrosporus DSM 14697]
MGGGRGARVLAVASIRRAFARFVLQAERSRSGFDLEARCTDGAGKAAASSFTDASRRRMNLSVKEAARRTASSRMARSRTGAPTGCTVGSMPGPSRARARARHARRPAGGVAPASAALASVIVSPRHQEERASRVRMLGASRVRMLGASRVRMLGAARVRMLGAARVRMLGASRVRMLGASRVRMLGASRVRMLGAARVRMLGASRVRMLGASRVRMLGASRVRMLGAARVRMLGAARVRMLGAGADARRVAGADARRGAGADARRVAGADARRVAGADARRVAGADARRGAGPWAPSACAVGDAQLLFACAAGARLRVEPGSQRTRGITANTRGGLPSSTWRSSRVERGTHAGDPPSSARVLDGLPAPRWGMGPGACASMRTCPLSV